MKYLILFLLLLPLSLIGQVESQFNGTLNVFSGTRIGSTNTFTISGIFNSTTTSYTSSQSDTGDIVQVQSGARFYWLHIYSIASNAGGVITCNVRDSSSTLTTFPLGKWSIFRPTPNLRLPLSPDGETNASRSSTFNTLALRVDEIQASVSSATNCELTITKNAHGFSPWTPVFYNGSTYIRPTNDSIVPDYIVVDSLTANTFKVATCGTYATVLPNGLYWYTNESPGYNLTPDTTKAPLFQVIDSTLLLNPIVGFNLMSGGGGTADGNGIYSGSDSLSQENTYAAMAADGSQNFGIGYFPSFPQRTYATDEYGLLISQQEAGEITLLNKDTYLSLYDNSWSLVGASARTIIEGTQAGRLLLSGIDRSSNRSTSLYLDSLGYHFISGSNNYDLPINSEPSTTSGVVNILKWTGDGTFNAMPSFGYRYETDSIFSDVNVKMDNTKTLAIGNFASFPSLGYDGTDAGLYLSEYNGSMNLAYGDALMDVFDDSFRFGVYDFTGTASGDFVQLILSKSTNQISFAGDNGTPYSYVFPKTSPPATAGAISSLSWAAGIPSFLRSQHGVATGTTDGSGDLTVTFAAAMPDATYTMIATVEGTTSYTISVHTKTTGTCKVRFFNPTTGAAVTATSVTLSYEAKDY